MFFCFVCFAVNMQFSLANTTQDMIDDKFVELIGLPNTNVLLEFLFN